MDRSEANAFAQEKLAAGAKKQDVFNALCQQGVKEQIAALAVASYADPGKMAKARVHVYTLIAIIWIQVAIGFLVAFNLANVGTISSGQALVVVLVSALISAVLTYGFLTNRAHMYNALLGLCILAAINQVRGLIDAQGIVLLLLAMTAFTAFYCIFVRSKLFPDFGFMSPRKVDGRYVFTD